MVSLAEWILNTWRYVVGGGWIAGKLGLTPSRERTEAEYNALPAWAKDNDMVKWAYDAQLAQKRYEEEGLQAPLVDMIKSYQSLVQEAAKKYDLSDLTKVEQNSANMSADIIGIALGTAGLEFGLSHLPNTAGTVASTKVHTMLAWAGVGAVLSAMMHDPVKIAYLRVWQDTLEAKYRNRRPDDNALYNAYRTRELSPAKVADIDAITDAQMDAIEDENQKVYDREIAKWGYSVEFAAALARSATRTLTFSNMMQLAKQGLLTRGYAIYNLWGYGLDRIAMKGALDALMAQNKMASYEGFRSMIEPSYTNGDIEEADLRAYYDRIMVPKELQDWVMPRLTKAREKNIAKQKGQALAAAKDLTQSQIATAYVDGLMTREKAKDDTIRLGYDATEAEILMSIADTRKKTPSASKLKRLTLTDYEKAFKNKLISLDAVLQRMQGEYDPRDIALERELLEIGKA